MHIFKAFSPYFDIFLNPNSWGDNILQNLHSNTCFDTNVWNANNQYVSPYLIKSGMLVNRKGLEQHILLRGEELCNISRVASPQILYIFLQFCTNLLQCLPNLGMSSHPLVSALAVVTSRHASAFKEAIKPMEENQSNSNN